MAASKNLRTLITAGTTVTAGSPTNGTEVDCSTNYGGLLTILLTNGGTAPTVAANAYVYTGGSTGVKKLFAKLAGDTVNSSTNAYNVEIPMGCMFLNITVQDNTVQNITAEAYFEELTTI